MFKTKGFIVFFLIFFLSGCGIATDYLNALSLKKYFLNFVKAADAHIEEISYKMSPSFTRTGYFLFEITDEEFLKLKEGLPLKEKEILVELEGNKYLAPEIHMVIKRCSTIADFIVKNPNYEKDSNDGETANPFLPNVKVFVAEPPLPTKRGFDRSLFEFMVCNSDTKQCCAFMQYPVD